MMIEPPRESFGGSVLEVDDCILIAVKHVQVEESTGTVGQSGVVDFGERFYSFFIEPRECCCGRNSIETMTVIKQTKFHNHAVRVYFVVSSYKAQLRQQRRLELRSDVRR